MNPRPARRLSLDEVKRRIKEKHGDVVSIVDASYWAPDLKRGYARFIDVEFGDWISRVNNVCHGTRHPRRGSREGGLKFRASYERLQVADKRKATNVARHGVEYPAQSKVIYSKVVSTNIERYGTPNPMQNAEVHARNKSTQKRSTYIKHWSTDQRLLCTAGYEVAFVNWCNFHRIDFDWQVPYKMPDGHVYFVDAFIKTGEFAGTWIEIKGFWYRKSEPVSRAKWELFRSMEPKSLLWTREELLELGILVGRDPNPLFGHLGIR